MKRTILVVDDEQNMRALMRMILEDAGYRVFCAESAEAAMPLLQGSGLNVILSDLKMPGMTGEAFVVACRRERPDGFTDGALDALKQYSWPGNVRELRNAIERALLTARGSQIQRQDLPDTLTETIDRRGSRAGVADEEISMPLDNLLEQTERERIFGRSNSAMGYRHMRQNCWASASGVFGTG